jgi:carbonic anhydrase
LKIVEITYRYEARDVPIKPRPADADAARARLEAGNRSFAALLEGMVTADGIARRVVPVDAHDLGLLPDDPARPPQRPFACILGCSDARVPVELIFNEGPNDLFVVRVAGNGLGSEVLGSLRFAVENLAAGLKLLVVLGHSGCGAITAAVDVFLQPTNYLAMASNFTLRSLLDRPLIAIQFAAQALSQTFGPTVTERPGYRPALVELSVLTNAAFAAYTLQRNLSDLAVDGIRAVYAVYRLETREVWAPHGTDAGGSRLADPPSDAAGFMALARAGASPRIAELLAAA